MNTTIKALIATSLSVIILTGTKFGVKAASKDNNVTVLSEVKNINKIVVSGNVELILIQNSKEYVKVYDSYYNNNALVQQQNGTLRISSFNKEKLTVVAYVNNLSSLEANDNATIKTVGKFNLLDLDLALTNNASAFIDANTVNLSTRISDNSKLSLAGTTTDYFGVMSSFATLNMAQFNAENTSINTKNEAPAKTYISKSKAADEPLILDEVALNTL